MTSDQLKEFTEYKFSKPFAQYNTERAGLPSYFSANNAVPVPNGGSPISRKAMNELGYYATIGTFLDHVGYAYPWNAGDTDKSTADKIPGGYPKGAIVSLVNKERFYEFLNTVENNTQKPVTDDDGTITEDVAQNGWQPTSRLNDYSFFPNYENRTLVNEFIVTGAGSNGLQRTITIPTPGWILVERTIANWDDLPIPAIIAEKTQVYFSYYPDWYGPAIGLYEGPRASRLLPCSGTLTLNAEVYGPVTSMTISVYLYEMEA